MSSPAPWELGLGFHVQTLPLPNPADHPAQDTDSYEALCDFTRSPLIPSQGEGIRIRLTFSAANTSPYTFHGTGYYTKKSGHQPYRDTELGSFEVQGTGTFNESEDGREKYESHFHIEEGLGKGELVGVAGSGVMKVEIEEEKSVKWKGRCNRIGLTNRGASSIVFEHLNEVGAVLK
ncbi:MAG: hypothetical protein Q9169_006116 [Polycauliona sp. 2 TL-2023]